MQTASAPEAAVLVTRAEALRDYLDQRQALTRWLETVAVDPSQNALVCDEALRALAQIDLHKGELSGAERKYRALGFLREWAIIGPFPSDDGLEIKAGPEQGFDPSKSFRDANGQPRAWRQVRAADAWLDLANFYSRANSELAFAATSLYAPNARTVALRFSGETAFTLSLNGQEVFRERDGGRLAFDQHAVAVQLRPGWNTVLLKLYRGDEESWRFGVRVTALPGGGIPLKISASQKWDGRMTAFFGGTGQPDDLLATAREELAKHGGSAGALETLARLEQARGAGSPAEHMALAAQREPSAERWFALAELSPPGPARLSALRQALAADTRFVPAAIALADYYADRGQLEKSRDLLQRAVAASPGDFVAGKRRADVHAAAGLNSLAAEEYQRIEREFPQPLWVKRELAAAWENFGLLDRAQTLAQAALREHLDGADEHNLVERIAERRRDTAALRDSYESAVRVAPHRTLPLAKLAALEAGSGKFAAAISRLRRALAIDPESGDLHRRMGELLGEAGRPQEARRELARALEINPHLESVRRRLEFESGQAADPDAEYLADAAALAADARQSARPENALMLGNVRVQRVYTNGLNSARVQQVTYIGSDEAARERAIQTVQYAPASESLRILHARIFKHDGSVVEAETAGDSQVSDTSIAMYYDVRSRAIRFPGLEKGDTLELDYRISPTVQVNPYGDYFGELVAFRTELPQRLQRYVLVAPARRTLYAHEERMPAPALVSTSGNERVYRWEARNLPGLAGEPRGPALTEVAPYVHVSTFASWEQMGRWYARLIRPQFGVDSALRQALARVLQGQRTPEEKIRAIHRFVVRSTHYVAMEFGIYSYKPYPVSQTYARRFGDCKDKASLMIALLRAAGIDARIALVRTRRLGAVAAQPASISIFDHAIVYVPGYDLWLDGTAEYAGPRELPINDQGALALTVDLDGRSQLRRIPVSASQDNYTRRTVRAQVGHDGIIRFSGTTYTRGEDAPGLRRDFELRERQRDSLRQRLAEVFPTVRVENVNVQGAHDLDRDITVEFRGALDSFAGRNVLSLASSWMPRAYVDKLAPLTARTQDLLLPAAWTTEEELHIELPDGASVAALPRDRQLRSPFGSASLHFERSGDKVVVHTRVEFHQTRIAPREYASFRGFCGELERAFRQEVKVELR